MKEIDDFLRENKPQVKDNPTFILEAQQRMEEVEGIRAEVERQHRHGRLALIIALAAGLSLGVLATAVAFLYPVDASTLSQGVGQSVLLFLETWRQYLLLPVALMGIALGLLLFSRKKV